MTLVSVYSSADLQELYRLKAAPACRRAGILLIYLYRKIRVEGEGIEASILDENISTLAPHMTFAQGMRLIVHESAADRAKEIIEDHLT